MFPVKIVIAGLIVIAAMAGCVKKKASRDNEFASTTSTATKPSASQDIFDEFYKEDTAAKKTETGPTATGPVARAPVTAGFSETGRIVVQVSTIRSRTLANKINAQLSAKGYPAYIAEVENPTPSLPGTYYRIRIGGFTTIAAARSFGENTLSAEGYEYWVDNRSNDNVGLQGSGMGSGDTYYSTEPSSTPPPATDYQSSYPTQPAPAEAAAPEPAPASSYTPESAAKEFDATPAATPPPAPVKSDKPAGSDPGGSEGEWGNEGW